MEQAVLLMASISFMLLGLSYLFRSKEWNIWVHQAERKGKLSSLNFGAINVMMGSFVLAFHPVWEGLPVILTVIGLLALIKGAIYILFPAWLPAKLKVLRTSGKLLFRASGVVLIVIATILLYAWCSHSGADYMKNWDQVLQREKQ